jgi:hypothetical protein
LLSASTGTPAEPGKTTVPSRLTNPIAGSKDDSDKDKSDNGKSDNGKSDNGKSDDNGKPGKSGSAAAPSKARGDAGTNRQE